MRTSGPKDVLVKKLLAAGSLFGALSCGYGCVARGARVRVAAGTRLIEDLVVGDEVVSVDPISGRQAIGRLSAIRIARRECVRLTTNESELTLTSDHPVYCPETGQWAPAGDWVLGPRKQLLAVTTEGLRPVRATKVSAYCGLHDVFDLTVNHPLHNFVANGLLVHNKSPINPSCVFPDGGTFKYAGACACEGGGQGMALCDYMGGQSVCAGCSRHEVDDAGTSDAGTSDGGDGG